MEHVLVIPRRLFDQIGSFQGFQPDVQRYLPAMLDNQKTKLASLRLFGESPLARVFQKKLHHQQGLLQVYEDFCLQDDSSCANCPFPERLAQWA